jgi:hypothetical protein
MITSDPKTGLQRNAQWSPIYDVNTVLLAAVNFPTSQAFFTTHTKSTNGRQVTNMDKAGELASPQKFTVHAIRLLVASTLIVELTGLLANMAVFMEVSGKIVCEGLVEYFSAGAGAWAQSQEAGTGTGDVHQNGVPDARSVVMFPSPYQIPIEAGEPFRVVLEGAGFALTGASIVTKCILEGVHEWPLN